MRLSLLPVEGALLRVLGLVGRRGYDVVHALVRPGGDGRGSDVEMVLEGAGSGEVLARQIEKLFDVACVEHRGVSI
jgi:acetolactate synthase regulatory subunit